MQDSLQQIIATHSNTLSMNEILTAILIIITAVYVIFTYRIMKASEKSVIAAQSSIDIMQKQINASLRPYIEVQLKRYPNHVIYMHIINTGKLNAEQVKFTIDKDFYPLGDIKKENLKEASIFKNGLNSLTPGTEITVVLLDIGQVGKIEDVSPSKFTITIKYSWVGQREPVCDKNEIDLTAFVGVGLFIKPDLLYEIADIKNFVKGISEKIK